MNRIFHHALTLLALLLVANTVSAQGITFRTGKWNDMLKEAARQNKLVFVDMYTSWCGPCKKMATQTFTQKEAGDFFNANFICYKMDAEKGEGIPLAKKYQITAYPTCLFVTSTGEIAYRFMGAKDVPSLLNEGHKAISYSKILPKMNALAKQYKAGKRDKAFLKEYVDLIIGCGEKPGLPLTEYLKTLSDEELFAPSTLALYSKVTIYDKDLFNRLSAHYILAPDTTKKSLGKPIMKAIGGCLSPLIDGKKENIDVYEALLSVKQNLGIKDDPSQMFMGGGPAYMPSDELRLMFYETADVNHYKQLVPKFMAANVNLSTADSISIALLKRRQKIVQHIDSFKAIGDTSALKTELARWNFGKVILSLTYQSGMDFIATTALKYWNMSDKSKAVTDQCRSWAEYAYKIYDRSPVAEDYATLLDTIGDHAAAKTVLQDALKAALEDPSGTPSENDVKQIRAKMAQLKF